MSRRPLFLWLLTELWRLYLTPAAAETVVTALLGWPATLPCSYPSWSVNSNSMCWGKGPCPNSKCTEELLHTDGARVLSRRSLKYDILGDIRRGNISLTIFNTREGDSAVYCCRIEVPGWFNDIKRNIRLQLRKAPTTTRRPTTRRLTTTTAATTTVTTTTATTATTAAAATTSTTAMPPTTVLTTPDLPATTPLQTSPTTALTVATTTCPLEAPSTLPEATPSLPTTEPATEEPVLTAESETSFLPKANSGDTARGSETTTLGQSKVENNQMHQVGGSLLKIIASSLAFALCVCALIVAFYHREKVMKTNCFHKHTRLDNAGGSKRSVLDDDIQHGREDEDGLFTL